LEAALPQQVTSWSADTLTANLALIEDAAVAIAALFDTAGGMKDIMAILVELTMLLEVDSVDSRTRARENGLQMTKFQANKLRQQGRKGVESAMFTLILQLAVAVLSSIMAFIAIRNSMSQIDHAKSANQNYKASFQ